jgi:hypothetical protein
LKTTIDIGDIFNDSNTVANPDNSISLVLNEVFDMDLADSAVTMGDTISNEAFNVPVILTVLPGQKVIKKYSNTQLDFGEMQLTKSKASRAKIKFNVRSGIKQPLLISYKLYSATKDGIVYETLQEVPGATDTAFAKLEKFIEFDDYILDLTGSGHDAYNTIYALTTVWLHPDADTVLVYPADSISIVSTFDEFVPEYVSGYLGKMTMEVKESTALQSFDKLKSGAFNLENTKAQIDIYNYIGADVSIDFLDLSTIKNTPQQRVTLNHSIVGSSINLTRASESNNPDYPAYPVHKHYDIINSNLNKMIEIMPDSISYNMRAELNPLGNISSGNDFLYFDRTIKANINIEIPLELSVTNLVFENIADLNFSESIISGSLNVFLENMFPFDFNVQLYILNNQGQKIDSLINTNTLIEAGIPINEVVKTPTLSVLKIQLTEKLISELKLSNKLLIKLKVNSNSNMVYKLYNHYNIDLKIVGDLEYEI